VHKLGEVGSYVSSELAKTIKFLEKTKQSIKDASVKYKAHSKVKEAH